MATAEYMSGRKRYQRPQAVLWSENSGTLTDGLYIPNGYEIGADTTGVTDTSLFNQFLILSDDNRNEINITPDRIEQRQRTINGRMRSYHIADKIQYSWSWDMLPSRAYFQVANFDSYGISPYKNTTGEFTTDGGAGGVAILDWYNSHPGPFWMYLAYDKYSNFKTGGQIVGSTGAQSIQGTQSTQGTQGIQGTTGIEIDQTTNNSSFGHLAQYNEIVQVYFSSFNYSIVKRGGNNYDFWNISVTLEEV